VASAKGHARKANSPFELTTEFIETDMPGKGAAATLPAFQTSNPSSALT